MYICMAAYTKMRILSCGGFLPVGFITTYWAKNPPVLIKNKGKSECVEEEVGVGEVCEETTEEKQVKILEGWLCCWEVGVFVN